jgi:polysaccharide pyruvyl transferase WcaK-like protein
MKIGILTQPLHNNYGGILQAFALQTIFKKLGHEAWIINREYRKPSFLKRCASYIKWIIFNYLLKKEYTFYSPTKKEKEIIATHTSKFKKKYIFPITKKIKSTSELKKLKSEGFDAFIVGSDQVWRPRYSPCISNYFLDFADNWSSIKRIAYAASFGNDDWEFNYKQTIKCARLARKFDVISVREDSGVDFCKKYFGVDAVHVLDPTMLLDTEEYKKIVEEENETQCSGNLMVYILDESFEKDKIIQSLANKLNLIPFSLMPKPKFSKSNRDLINNCIYPTVTRWLKGFIDAEFIVTDSFHGVIFSILFNKPFIAIGNKNRGMTRFESLLNLFNLNDRLLDSKEEITSDLLNNNIYFNLVNQTLIEQKEKSLSFLKSALSR